MGRKGLSTNGREHYGRMYYEKGMDLAMSAFRDAHVSADPKTLMLAEEAFLQQEQQFCAEGDPKTLGSLTQALRSFDDAFRCAEIAEDAAAYRSAEATYPTAIAKCRHQGFPKDAFHQTCMSHYTRLQNVVRSPGINLKEKTVLEQRAANMKAAQRSYTEKQRKALGVPS